MRYILFLVKVFFNPNFFNSTISIFPILAYYFIYGYKIVLCFATWKFRTFSTKVNLMFLSTVWYNTAFNTPYTRQWIISAARAFRFCILFKVFMKCLKFLKPPSKFLRYICIIFITRLSINILILRKTKNTFLLCRYIIVVFYIFYF